MAISQHEADTLGPYYIRKDRVVAKHPIESDREKGEDGRVTRRTALGFDVCVVNEWVTEEAVQYVVDALNEKHIRDHAAGKADA